MASRNVVLIGFMGAGKSVVARALADLLGYEAVDTDAIVERDTGSTVAAIFEAEGEAGFRRRESAILEQIASGDGRVIACGGGAILSLKNLAALQDAGPIVYLRATPATLIERLGSGEGRPLLSSDPARAVPVLLAEREPVYRSASDLIIETDGKEPEQIAREIAEALS